MIRSSGKSLSWKPSVILGRAKGDSSARLGGAAA